MSEPLQEFTVFVRKDEDGDLDVQVLLDGRPLEDVGEILIDVVRMTGVVPTRHKIKLHAIRSNVTPNKGDPYTEVTWARG